MQERFCHNIGAFGAIYDTVDRSILLHELVRHMQAFSVRFGNGSGDGMRRNAVDQEVCLTQLRYLMETNDARQVSMTGWAARCHDANVPMPHKALGRLVHWPAYTGYSDSSDRQRITRA
jgi:hypothetical protein